MLLKNSSVGVIFVATLVIINKCFGAGQEYGEDCTADTPCNPDHWLVCNATTPGKCGCQNNTYWIQPFCSAIIGTECNEENSSNLILKCIDNAECKHTTPGSEKGICECKSGFIPTPSNLKCLRGHEVECQSDGECNHYAGLRCRGNRCTCGETNKQIWDEIGKRCVKLVGEFCTNTTGLEFCVENSNCNPASLRCECTGNTFKETMTRECKLRYNQTCSSNYQCNTPMFQCLPHDDTDPTTQTVCKCDPMNEEYDPTSDICRIKAGKSCNVNSYCVEHAVCDELTKLCQCTSLYEESEMTGHCVAGYGTSCRTDKNICNPAHNLVCSEENQWKCDCAQGYFMMTGESKCLGLNGTSCKSDQDCISTAECLNSTTCACKSGHTVQPKNHNLCELDHGQTCVTSPGAPATCDEYRFLHCDISTRKCNCTNPTIMTYDPNMRMCVGMAGKLCYMQEIDEKKLECVSNAECLSDGVLFPGQGRCECTNGFSELLDGSCGTKDSGVGSLYHSSSYNFLFIGLFISYFISQWME